VKQDPAGGPGLHPLPGLLRHSVGASKNMSIIY
jgi:hypothetical protein